MITKKSISRLSARHASPAKTSWQRPLAATHFFGADAAANCGGRQEWDLPSQQHTSINSPALLRVSTIALWKCSSHLDRRQMPPLISAYAPSMTSPNEIKDVQVFWRAQLQHSLCPKRGSPSSATTLHASALTTKPGIDWALFTVNSVFWFASQYNVACMLGNFGLFCSFSPKLY